MERPTRRIFASRPVWALFITVAVLNAAFAASALAPDGASLRPPDRRVQGAAAPREPVARGAGVVRARPVRVVLPPSQSTPEAPFRGVRPVTELKLIKVVDNSSGGSATTADWILQATGAATENPTNLSGASPVDSIDQWPDFQPDVYALSETFVGSDPAVGAAYTASAWTCVDNQSGEPVAVTEGASVVIAAGDDVTCTIVNSSTQLATPTPTLTPTPSSPCLPCIILGRKLYVAWEGPYQGELVGLSGWLVTATLVGDETVQATTTTDALGRYRFTADDLVGMAFPGATIRVCEEDRPGWVHLTPPCTTVTFPYPMPPGYPGAVAPDFVNAQRTSPPQH